MNDLLTKDAAGGDGKWTGSKRRGLLFAGVLIIVALLLALSFKSTTRVERICPHCGARQYRTEWVLGLASTPEFRPSPLSEWLSLRGVHHEHEWVLIATQSRNLFGQVISAGSTGNPPPVMQISDPKLNAFLKSAPADQINSFFDVMLKGSPDKQDEAIREYGLN